MAITKLLRLKESAKGNRAAHLKHNLFYICDPDKCGGYCELTRKKVKQASTCEDWREK